MNRTKIEWCDYSWSPITGCLHACPYCYAARIDKRFGDGSFAPTFHPERLQDPLKAKKPSRIFVGSMADLFGDWDWKVEMGGSITRDYIIHCIFNIVEQCPQHAFIFLTKNPKGMQGFDFPVNCWCGTSVENQEKANERIPELLKVKCKTLFISYEPALGPVDFTDLADGENIFATIGVTPGPRGEGVEYPIKPKIKWLIIGAQTGPGAAPPKAEWIAGATYQARSANIPLFIKNNCNWPEQIREWPE